MSKNSFTIKIFGGFPICQCMFITGLPIGCKFNKNKSNENQK